MNLHRCDIDDFRRGAPAEAEAEEGEGEGLKGREHLAVGVGVMFFFLNGAGNEGGWGMVLLHV